MCAACTYIHVFYVCACVYVRVFVCMCIEFSWIHVRVYVYLCVFIKFRQKEYYWEKWSKKMEKIIEGVMYNNCNGYEKQEHSRIFFIHLTSRCIIFSNWTRYTSCEIPLTHLSSFFLISTHWRISPSIPHIFSLRSLSLSLFSISPSNYYPIKFNSLYFQFNKTLL